MSLGRERPLSTTTNAPTKVLYREIRHRKATTQQSYDNNRANPSRSDHICKKSGGDEIRGQSGNNPKLEIQVFPYVFFVQVLHIPKIKHQPGRMSPKIQNFEHFSLVSLSLRT